MGLDLHKMYICYKNLESFFNKNLKIKNFGKDITKRRDFRSNFKLQVVGLLKSLQSQAKGAFAPKVRKPVGSQALTQKTQTKDQIQTMDYVALVSKLSPKMGLHSMISLALERLFLKSTCSKELLKWISTYCYTIAIKYD